LKFHQNTLGGKNKKNINKFLTIFPHRRSFEIDKQEVL